MRSRTSYFNRALFRKNLTRFWPLWGGASFVGALFPLALLSHLLRGRGRSVAETALEMTRTYYDAVQGVLPFVCLFYGVLCALAVWSYLCSSRSVGLLHALPIRREGLFVTNFLSGYAMLLIPFAVTGALSVLVTAAFGLFDPAGLAVTVLAVLGESFFYFSSATLAAFITGNLFAMPALYLLLHFLEAVLDLLLSSFAKGFLFGFCTDYTGLLEFLSPTVYLIDKVRVDAEYREITNYAGEYVRDELISVRLESAWLIAVYALAGAALLALAFALYRRRQSERAGDVVAVGWMRPVFRYGGAALAALLGGQLLYGLFFNDEYFKVVPLVLFMMVAGAIGYYAASMLLSKTFRVFAGSWRGLALVAIGVVLACGLLKADVLRVADRVPEIDQVREVSLYTEGDHYVFYPGEEDELLEQVRTLHAAIAADRDYILNFTDREAARCGEADWTWTYLNLTYTTKGGRTVSRQYDVPLTRDRLGQSGTCDNLLDRLINSQEMRLKRIHASGDGYEPVGGSIYLNARGEGVELSDREAAAILEAVTRDALADRWGQVDWLEDADGESCKAREGEAYAMSLDLSFSRQREDVREGDWIGITVRPGMTATTACLLELGLARSEDLVTRAELYPDEYENAVQARPAAEDVVYPETAFRAAVVTGRIG